MSSRYQALSFASYGEPWFSTQHVCTTRIITCLLYPSLPSLFALSLLCLRILAFFLVLLLFLSYLCNLLLLYLTYTLVFDILDISFGIVLESLSSRASSGRTLAIIVYHGKWRKMKRYRSEFLPRCKQNY